MYFIKIAKILINTQFPTPDAQLPLVAYELIFSSRLMVSLKGLSTIAAILLWKTGLLDM